MAIDVNRRFRAVVLGLVLGTAAGCYGLALWKVPDLMQHGRLTDPKDRHNARLLVTSVGGAVVLAIGLLYTAGSYRLAHRGQVTDRFTKALERLDSEELYVRYGGILALEQIVQDAPDQAADAARVLGAFVRTLAPQRGADPAELPERPHEDLQAALTGLARHNRRHRVRRQQPIILERLHLTGVRLSAANLTGARLNAANLTKAEFDNAKISNAELNEADLSHARCFAANLTKAELCRADLTRARLHGANLTGAKLFAANLSSADLHYADLTGADLNNADLTDARLFAADLTGADLSNADLTGADLELAKLTGARLKNASLIGANLSGAVLDGMIWSFDTMWPSADIAKQVQARSDEMVGPERRTGFAVRKSARRRRLVRWVRWG